MIWNTKAVSPRTRGCLTNSKNALLHLSLRQPTTDLQTGRTATYVSLRTHNTTSKTDNIAVFCSSQWKYWHVNSFSLNETERGLFVCCHGRQTLYENEVCTTYYLQCNKYRPIWKWADRLCDWSKSHGWRERGGEILMVTDCAPHTIKTSLKIYCRSTNYTMFFAGIRCQGPGFGNFFGICLVLVCRSCGFYAANSSWGLNK